jgi:hypothetical protein
MSELPYHRFSIRHFASSSEIPVQVRGDPPNIIAHCPILVERIPCSQHPCDYNYSNKAKHAGEADEHDKKIIAAKNSATNSLRVCAELFTPVTVIFDPVAGALPTLGSLPSAAYRRPVKRHQTRKACPMRRMLS